MKKQCLKPNSIKKRRKFTSKQKIEYLKEAIKLKNNAKVIKKYGLIKSQFYAWKKKGLDFFSLQQYGLERKRGQRFDV